MTSEAIKIIRTEESPDTSSSHSLDRSSALSLEEDHFLFTDNVSSSSNSSLHDLEEAEKKCKTLVLDSKEMSDERKQFVRQLIELRIKIQNLKELEEISPGDLKIVDGHVFKAKQGANHKAYCETCAGVVWPILYGSFECTECHYRCHNHCLSHVRRRCAILQVAESMSYILDICPEKGLETQDHKCQECRTPITFRIGMSLSDWLRIESLAPSLVASNFFLWERPQLSSAENSWVEPRLCDYDGLYYCPTCHWNWKSVIPARVVHNWDFEERKVSQASKQYLLLMYSLPVLKLESLNPMLFGFVEELRIIKRLREELLLMKDYFVTCKTSVVTQLLRSPLKDRPHFAETSELYSLQDLVDINSGILLESLQQIHDLCTDHIRNKCTICQGKGFKCELCESKDTLFAFDVNVTSCDKCYAVYHKVCMEKCNSNVQNNCLKCGRIAQRAQQIG